MTQSKIEDLAADAALIAIAERAVAIVERAASDAELAALAAHTAALREHATGIAAHHGLTLDAFIDLSLTEKVRLKHALPVSEKRRLQRQLNRRQKAFVAKLLAAADGGQS